VKLAPHKKNEFYRTHHVNDGNRPGTTTILGENQITSHLPGTYGVSKYLPMLQATRDLIAGRWQECMEIAYRSGYAYNCPSVSSKKPLALLSEKKQGVDRNQNELCVIVRYYSGQRNAFLALLSSIYAWKREDVLIKIVITEPNLKDHKKSVEDLAQALNSLHQYFGSTNTTRTELLRFNYFSPFIFRYRAENRKCAENDYGYTLTDMELASLVNQDICKYIMITNGDNLYHIGLMKETELLRQDGIDLMIGFFFISRYSSRRQNSIRDSMSPNTLYRTKFIVGGIDLGACMFKSSVFHNNNHMRFCKMKGRVQESDGQLIQYVAKNKMYRAKVLDQIMFMHQ